MLATAPTTVCAHCGTYTSHPRCCTCPGARTAALPAPVETREPFYVRHFCALAVATYALVGLAVWAVVGR